MAMLKNTAIDFCIRILRDYSVKPEYFFPSTR